MSRAIHLPISAPKAALIVLVAILLLPFGVPRFLTGDDAPTAPTPEAFAKLCRQHGGTPKAAPSSATNAPPQPLCTVRYGHQVYVMDAITPRGFDADTARFQRQGCRQAQLEQRASGDTGHHQTFIYHPDTGVCEHRT